MSQYQQCPHCGLTNRVAGLHSQSPDSVHEVKPREVYCGCCGEKFAAKENPEPKPLEESNR